ncbi:MAG: hypothetical protein JNL16_14925 [Dechloromonas sp.]|nr:hypothetical protein [Dechloromonas sp.]
MKFRRILPALLLLGISLSAGAVQFACPDLGAARQVNACPSEEELKHTYSGFCSDDKKAYAGETDNCMRYDDYRAMKNTALWESADGAFDGYVSCDLPQARLKALKATGMKVAKQGSITKVMCNYPNGVNFTYRTKVACKVEDDKACATDSAACRASCN